MFIYIYSVIVFKWCKVLRKRDGSESHVFLQSQWAFCIEYVVKTLKELLFDCMAVKKLNLITIEIKHFFVIVSCQC